MRHLFHTEHAATVRFVDLRHLLEAGDVRIDEVICEVDEERLVADSG
jgi:hypothetical protein